MAKVVVQAQERVLVYRDGVFETQLEPGRRADRGGCGVKPSTSACASCPCPARKSSPRMV
jgi:hypothetical protein